MSVCAARVVAHAKINLALRVLAREASGYHSIETIFARLAMGDLVTVRVHHDGARTIDCSGEWSGAVGPGEENLAYRAAVAFADTVGWPPGFSIEIEKRIPVGGGLGGGSADAGAVLRALAALAPRPVPVSTLLALAASLGSDVPYLTTTAPLAIGWGRGERLLELPPLPERAVVLVIPSFAVSTREAYEWVSAARGEHGPAPQSVPATRLGSWEGIAALAENDFEGPVAARHPELHQLLGALRGAGALIARLSGSGSTVYGIFSAPPPLDALRRSVSGTVVETHTLARISEVELLR
jgi:4-diphosphocytidyl-2-C-methyl-D-erythritol kinase